ncbi:MAG TPA: methyltransferase domain-containing protein [Candidatus Acidoferrales bacterium]|nr:methyltransferase domain-containing protein [Candidatus Acidoferrales bacterium]
MIAQLEEQLVCPGCSAPLEEKSGRLRCPCCREAWPIVDGIPEFVEEFPYWGEIPAEQMREVNRAAETRPWKAVLLDSADPKVRRAAEMITALGRANWHLLANLPPESRVLDLGAGTGTNSHALALHYREVVAVEPVRERVEFMRRRFTQEGLSNIKILRSSLWKLPFPPESFDLVAMNGVLEWVAESVAGDPGEVQERALRKAASVLKPGGCLYLGIENRYCAGYFIGYPDPHSGVPFVTVLPRFLANWYSRRKGLAGGYRNYLYSSRGYRKLLLRSGFSRVEVYLALPSYNSPRFLIPLDGDAYSYYARNQHSGRPGRVRNAIWEVLLRLKLLKYVEYSFAIFAYK